jgi:hypothetical protein
MKGEVFVMFVNHLSTRLPRRMLVGLGCILLALLLATGLVFALQLRLSPRAHAASLQQPPATTCAQAPTIQHCNNQDPEVQGCAADAVTIGQADIKENGFTIGRVERRWSLKCQSWWGRVFDLRPDSQASMYITINGATTFAAPTFVSGQYRILYSPMVFDATPTQPGPEITGALEIDGITTPPSATLPAVHVPGR